MKRLKRLNVSVFTSIFIILLSFNSYAEEGLSKKILDEFNDLGDWQTFKSKQAEIKLVSGKGFKGKCLGLNFDFTKRKGYVGVSKDVSLSLPENYKFIFYIKGHSQENNLEFKLIDEKGDTYWKKWNKFKFTDRWRKVLVGKKDIIYGWGPGGGRGLKKVKRIEFAVSCGEGGKGEVYIDELSFMGFEETTSFIRLEAKASSYQDEQYSPQNAVDGKLETLWHSKPVNKEEWFEVN